MPLNFVSIVLIILITTNTLVLYVFSIILSWSSILISLPMLYLVNSYHEGIAKLNRQLAAAGRIWHLGSSISRGDSSWWIPCHLLSSLTPCSKIRLLLKPRVSNQSSCETSRVWTSVRQCHAQPFGKFINNFSYQSIWLSYYMKG